MFVDASNNVIVAQQYLGDIGILNLVLAPVGDEVGYLSDGCGPDGGWFGVFEGGFRPGNCLRWVTEQEIGDLLREAGLYS